MKITGELLKAERLKKNHTVLEVATSLKLSSRIINALESGTTEDLPAKTFIRGFVKSYAQFLKLDADLILKQFMEEMGSTQPLPKVPPPLASGVDNKPQSTKSAKNRPPTGVPTNLDINQDNKRKTIIYASLASLLLFVILLVNNIVDKYQKETVIDTIEMAQVQPLPPPINSMVADNSNSVLVTNTNEPPGDKQAATPISAESVPQPTTVSPAEAVAEIAITTSSPSDFEPSLGKPVELIVEAKKDVEFFYAKGNTKNFTRVKLSSKEVQVIRSPSGLHLKSDDGGALHLILNGVDKGQAAAGAKPVRLTF